MPPAKSSTNTHWAYLADAVEQGNLYLDPETARQCFQVCEEFIGELNLHKDVAVHLADVKGLGSFDSGIALAKTFSEKAVGGANNLVDVLQSHIDVVMQMQAVFQKFFSATDTVDQDNAAAITQQNPPR
ncbi:hypothetical protein [Rhodococcoides yunnanense]|uniref:hypothetical protein n=1 Tax=Rhodococcoides yunnanense TaxID=278209 RepID=UPI000933939D|nr:hypothetical protein [Rhodococcus yunnanensis]